MVAFFLAAAAASQPSSADWITAAATFLAVVVALVIAIWGDWLKSLAARPKPTLSIAMRPPDCHRIQTVAHLPDGRVVGQFDSYYLRLAIGNKGRVAARSVEVRAIQLSRQGVNGEYVEDPHFLPMNLVWAHAGGNVLAAKIDPELPKHCDLVHVDQPQSDYLEFCTEVRPHEVAPGVWPTRKREGTYRLRLAITADNSKPVYRTLRIVFTGQWFDDENQMFERGVAVAVE